MAALTDVDIRAVFRMKPEDAVAFVKQKGFQLNWNWYESLNEAHAQAFTVAKVARMDVLQDIRNAVEASLEKGWSIGEFKRNLTPILQSKGWWGKQIIVDSQGEAEAAQLGSPRRLETIYRTNVQSALMAARYKQMLANVQFRPYWMYVAVMDGRTRPSHAALNGRVFRYDDPIWRYLYPPNGYNCRCRVVALSERDMKRRGLVLSSSDGLLVTREIDAGIDPRTGEVYKTEQTGIRLVHNGKPVIFYPDAGFNFNHGAAGLEQASQVLARKVEFADPELGAQAMQSALHLVLPQIAAEYRTWASQVIEAGRAANNYRVVGALQPDVLAALKRMDIRPETAALTVRDAELLHLVRDTKSARGAALPIDDILALPLRLAAPQAILWDIEDPALVYVFPAVGQQKTGKVVVRVDFAQQTRDDGGRQKMPRNAVRTAGLVEAGDLANGKRYSVLAGKVGE
ncbi:phage minor head protein [Ralstonia mannitolilytica]|uniref:phage head morphogenesis protein n=1 Tax=Ralstonia mannitolilytica TaxID=105219 RepID=UPI000CEE23E7|nr:phage minor head protein [Ralstonia mannitolilytica]